MARARESNRWPATEIGIKDFLVHLRKARWAARAADREEAKAEARQVQGELPDSVVLANADCRTYAWPSPLDVAYADPPWKCLDLYTWLATWAAEHLRAGGLALVQCSQHNLPEVMTALGARLTYLWTLNLVYSETQNVAASGRFRPGWRPVVIYAKGQAHIHESLSDTYTVRNSSKTFHEWEQPAQAWRYWLARLVRPASLLADVCAGSGLMALVCHELGHKYVGTELDPATFEVARGRVLKGISVGVGSLDDASSPK